MGGESVVMTTQFLTNDGSLLEAVSAAARQLVTIKDWGKSTFISVPIFYPSGAAVAIKVDNGDNGRFLVSDNGAAFREIECLGLERSFPITAKNAAARIDAKVKGREIFDFCTVDELAATIADIAEGSSRVAHKISVKARPTQEDEIKKHLSERLEAVFGEDSVEIDEKMIGQSTKSWGIDAIVHIDGRDVIFDFVNNAPQSVYQVSAKFHDLTALQKPPTVVSVVKDKAALGPYLNILSQAGRIIQDNQPDEAFKRAAA